MAVNKAQNLHIIIVAAGKGTRFTPPNKHIDIGSKPKQYELIGQLPVLAHSIQAFDHIQVEGVSITGITVVIHANDKHWKSMPTVASKHTLTSTIGGAQRHDSVRNGIKFLKSDSNDWVLVHDAARPCVTADEIKQLISTCLKRQRGGLLVKPITDTIKHSKDGDSVNKTVDRNLLFAALTPQMFRCGELLKALTVFEADSITDESSAIEAQGKNPLMVMGKSTNIKITTYEDLLMAETILNQQGRLP
ncbi:MAG: 2-C-methyl-D-erythritol 4-phosphate cytidylyltransferase [Marinicella sp.]